MKPFLISAAALLALASATFAASVGTVQHGIASWYGSEFKRTASGERYDCESLTAAHRTLPFGTMVRVTHLKSNRSTVVRINNRGPYSKGRVIDLSRAAARELNMFGSGIAKVKLEVIDRADASRTPRRASRVSESAPSDSRQ